MNPLPVNHSDAHTPSCEPFELELRQGRRMRIEPVHAQGFRIRYTADAPFTESMLIRYGVLHSPSYDGSFNIQTNETETRITINGAQLVCCPRTGQFELLDSNGELRLGTTSEPQFGSGFCVDLGLGENEAVYGLGDVAPERLNRRGTRIDMWVSGTNYHVPIPFLMGAGGWGVLVHTSWRHTIDVGCTDSRVLRIEGNEGELDLFVWCGKPYAELLYLYTDISGKPRMLPAWAYGLHFFGSVETSEREIVEDALKFRQDGIPCELIGLSDGWTTRGASGDFPVGDIPKSAPFIDTLHRHGFKFGLSMPCTGEWTEEAERRLRPEAQPSLGPERPPNEVEHLLNFLRKGVDALKVPSLGQTYAHPDRHYANGRTDNEMHNLQPVLLGMQLYDGYVKLRGTRPMLHSVVGYTGLQQFTATECGKYGLRASGVVSALNAGLSGHVHTAIHMHVDEPAGIHAGFLMPWAQNNSGRQFRHPSFLEDKQKQRFRMYARLRYRLFPYLYNAAHTACATGIPIVRAMPLAYPQDPRCADLTGQYMLGDELLVGAFSNNMYLPAGRWVDFWNGHVYEGTTTIDYAVPDHAGGPLFVRSGAIIPMRSDPDTEDSVDNSLLLLHLYPEGKREIRLLEDDGSSLGYMKGETASTRIACESLPDQTGIRIWRRQGNYSGMPVKRLYELIVHTGSKPTGVRLDGKVCAERTSPYSTRRSSSAGWKFDRRSGCVHLFIEEATDPDIPRHVELNNRPVEKPSGAAESNDGHGSISGLRTGTSNRPDKARREETDKWLTIALDTGVEEEVKSALAAWWHERMDGQPAESPGSWRSLLLDGCLLLVRHAEQRGWPVTAGFGAKVPNPLSVLDVPGPADGLIALEQLAIDVLAAGRHMTGAFRHPSIRETIAYVQRGLHGKLNLETAAERAGLHPVYLSRLFKKETGQSFTDYVLKQRMQRAKALLQSGMKVYEAAELCGFREASHFSRLYSQYWGSPPIAFRGKREPDEPDPSKLENGE